MVGVAEIESAASSTPNWRSNQTELHPGRKWSEWRDLNPRPRGPEPRALHRLSYTPTKKNGRRGCREVCFGAPLRGQVTCTPYGIRPKDGRSGGNRTRENLSVPSRALYQAELRSVCLQRPARQRRSPWKGFQCPNRRRRVTKPHAVGKTSCAASKDGAGTPSTRGG